MQLYIRGRVWDVICNGSQVSEDRREHAKNVMSGPICVMVSETLISFGVSLLRAAAWSARKSDVSLNCKWIVGVYADGRQKKLEEMLRACRSLEW